MAITDATGKKVLLLRRGPQVVTCPNSWSVVGEHAMRDETPLKTVQRALVEELWGGNNRSYTRDVGFIKNLTSNPVYYFKDYGPEKENRVDQSPIYLYEVRFKRKHADIALKLDEEAANHQWIDVDELLLWMQRDAIEAKYKDFCDPTISKLIQFLLERLKSLHTNQDAEQPADTKPISSRRLRYGS
jgi:ADP-ribose pyrophosphatase YjhB (NUDIX family)